MVGLPASEFRVPPPSVPEPGLRLLLLGVLPLTALWLPAQVTESPLTVEPGKFLVEMDVVSLSVDRDQPDDARYTAVGVASTFLTTGLTERLDVQVGAELFLTQSFDQAGLKERNSGIGDVYLRSKWTFWRADDGQAAAALLPYVKLPTNSGGVGNGSVEGGLIVPWMRDIPGGAHLHAMIDWAVLRNADDDGYDHAFFASASYDLPVTRAIGVYGELTAAKSTGGDPAAASLGAGVTLTVADNFWWDFAVYRGLNADAADWNPVVRLNWGF